MPVADTQQLQNLIKITKVRKESNYTNLSDVFSGVVCVSSYQRPHLV